LALPDKGVIDGPGVDLRIWGRPGQERPLGVELSEDGQVFESFGLVRAVGDLDLTTIGMTAAWYIRITDSGSQQPQDRALRSADIDAVEALHCLPLDQDAFKLEHLEVLAPLQPGEAVTVTVSWTATSAAEYTLVAQVDALDSITESDEANNKIERPIRVKK
jgi:hypothetical protein